MLSLELPGVGDVGQLVSAFGRRRHGFVLDSALPSNGLGRFCFAGSDPFLIFRAWGSRCETVYADGRVVLEEGDPLSVLRALHERHRLERGNETSPFLGGAVGFLTYEFGAGFEKVWRSGAEDFSVPEVEFGFYDAIVVWDVQLQRARLITTGVGGRDPERLQSDVLGRLAAARENATEEGVGQQAVSSEPVSNLGPEGFMAGVRRIREYIASGDVYQVNLAHRLECPFTGDPLGLYRRLRNLSPAPFGAYLNFGDMQVLSVSPERFVELRGRRVCTRPIKGTRPRGGTPEEDAGLRDALLASAKDKAELLMIVDLERNDLGRVCRIGSVTVGELYTLEQHPTVWHLVSEVSGALAEGRDVFDLVKASFPGGSITGAPKIRAMQIISELEPHARGIYTGSIGYLGFDGDAEFNIAIRTMVCRGGRAFYHVGGGITWDSDPAEEYAETLAKGRALFGALTLPRP